MSWLLQQSWAMLWYVCVGMCIYILEVIFINELLERLSSLYSAILVLCFLVVVQLLVQRLLHIA